MSKAKALSTSLPDIITSRRIDKFAVTNMREYGKYTVEQRAVPDKRDGLKPVQRRSLWSMYKQGLKASGGYKKAAKVTGDVMARYHPHGNCFRFDTEVYLLSGEREKIGNLVNKGSKWILAVDPKTNKIVPALAHSWRIGKKTKTIYRLHLSDDNIIEISGNHPFYNINNNFVKVKNIKPFDILHSASLYLSNHYLNIISNTLSGKKALHQLVGSFKEKISDEDIWHHKNENKTDNRPTNLETLTRVEHALHHKNYLIGLENGRKAMFSNKGKYRKATKKKNQIMMRAYNNSLWIIKAIKIVESLIDNNIPLTEKNYEKARLNIYNGTKYSTLIARGFTLDKVALSINTFQLDVSKAVGLTKKLQEKVEQPVNADTTESIKLALAAKVIAKMCKKNNVAMGWDTYEKTRKKMSNVKGKYNIFARNYPKKETLIKYGIASFDDLIGRISKYLIFVKEVEVIKLQEKEDLYDFTVDKYHNMLLPTGPGSNNFIVAHNSSIYDAIVTMANMPEALVDGQGAWGRLNTQAAAERYTELKLTAFAEKIFFSEPHLQVSELVNNYDGSEKEPLILPALLPALLINGAQGMSVGITVGVPPFKLKGVCKLIDMVLKNKTIKQKHLQRYLELNYKYGGELLDTQRLTAFYETGESAITLVPNYEYKPSNQTILITGVGPNFEAEWAKAELYKFDIVTKIHDLAREDKPLKMLVHLRDTDETAASVPQLMRKLADNITLRLNVTTRLPDEKVEFEAITIIKYLQMWTAWRLELESKAQLAIAANLDQDIKHNDLLIFGAENLDLMTKIIKKKEDRLNERLAAGLKISVEDAAYLASRTLRSYAGLNVDKLQQDNKQYKANAATARSIAKAPSDFVGKFTAKLASQFG